MSWCALYKAGFDDALIQRVVESRGNKLARRMYATVTVEHFVDPRFEKLHSFNVVVPPGRQLVSGRQFLVEVFQTCAVVGLADCFEHLRTQQAVLIGEFGIQLASEQARGNLPVNHLSLSFAKDEVDHDKNACQVWGVRRRPDDSVYQERCRFEFSLDRGICLLCFRDLDAESAAWC